MDIRYLGHSAFELSCSDNKILIDPYITVSDYDWNKENITNIFITHAHSDHIGYAIEIAKGKNARITAVFELANYCREKGCKNVEGVNLGAKCTYSWGHVRFLPSFHSSSLPDGRYGGCPSALLFEIENTKIYHCGDTCLHEGMKTVKELYKPQIAMLPVGGKYTMDIEDASIAAQWLGVEKVFPMHYNTFAEIRADIEQFANLIHSVNPNIEVIGCNK